ncbi:hypothetical protein D8771_05680 [Streptomyces albus]|uniref:Uncharacterized protein n=1 Tax=Streptomyces albus TaxID=1888 RepID=A0A8H1LLF5_9ACTN|nr:hypothetical protein D8771_05680 [Streptomyces albus]
MSGAVNAGCRDCAWFRTMISRARETGDDRSAADLEALRPASAPGAQPGRRVRGEGPAGCVTCGRSARPRGT